ncbi:MAG TPA: hypothetical protein VII56_17340 [Rhizomicrobium sp.]
MTKAKKKNRHIGSTLDDFLKEEGIYEEVVRLAKRRPKHISQSDWDAVDSPPLTASQLKRMRPASQVLPNLVDNIRRSRSKPAKLV